MEDKLYYQEPFKRKIMEYYLFGIILMMLSVLISSILIIIIIAGLLNVFHIFTLTSLTMVKLIFIIIFVTIPIKYSWNNIIHYTPFIITSEYIYLPTNDKSKVKKINKENIDSIYLVKEGTQSFLAVKNMEKNLFFINNNLGDIDKICNVISMRYRKNYIKLSKKEFLEKYKSMIQAVRGNEL